MESTQHRLPTAPRPVLQLALGGLSARGMRLADILATRGSLHLDRYGLIDLQEQGFSRQDVFRGLYELIITNRAELGTSRLGHVVVTPAPEPAPDAETLPAAETVSPRDRRERGRPRERRPAPAAKT